MYWLYAASFMLIVFFTLLNFFLAIVVDAFDEYDKLHCTYNFIYDLGQVPRSLYMHFKLKHPGRKRFIRWLEEALDAIKEVKKQQEQVRKRSGHKGVRHKAPPPTATSDPSLPPLIPAQKILDEFDGFTEASLCHLLCRVEKLSTTPVIFYVEAHEDNNEPKEVEDIPEEPSAVKNISKDELNVKIDDVKEEGVITSSM
ncbi:GIP [Symbiodinium natans]|uniref:GIP protein n=1 Tax=Symbiodinium natans TaxID=878477 RepID=A0A812GVF6_9DINO|nr:GIP [Symbiodinium natans]